jgi:ribosomal protein S18 acetylase RimI-like enzyme
MTSEMIRYSDTRDIPLDSILAIYRANGWSSSEKPELLFKALMGSETLLSAWDECKLVGLANAISDGFLVVYYPHLLVMPDYQGRGIGAQLVQLMKNRYASFHQHMLVAEANAIEFYRKCGFVRAGRTEPMWIYDGKDH